MIINQNEAGKSYNLVFGAFRVYLTSIKSETSESCNCQTVGL